MNTRKNHVNMSPAEKADFISAVLTLKNNVNSILSPGEMSRYDDFVQLHKNAMMGPNMLTPMPHHCPLFFPWHRVMIRQFELALQVAAGNANLALPYWDWDLSGTNSPFTDDFLGGDGDSAQGHRVVSGPFAYANGQFEIRVWDSTPGDVGLLRDFGAHPTASLPTSADVTSALVKTPYSPGDDSWEKTCEISLHDSVHYWVGGNMKDCTSPNDPFFFLHHCYIDLLWEKWKQQHPDADPYLPISGKPDYDLASPLVFNKAGKPAPWTGSWKVQDTLDTASLGYIYV
jgi:tyrosinase